MAIAVGRRTENRLQSKEALLTDICRSKWRSNTAASGGSSSQLFRAPTSSSEEQGDTLARSPFAGTPKLLPNSERQTAAPALLPGCCSRQRPALQLPSPLEMHVWASPQVSPGCFFTSTAESFHSAANSACLVWFISAFTSYQEQRLPSTKCPLQSPAIPAQQPDLEQSYFKPLVCIYIHI